MKNFNQILIYSVLIEFFYRTATDCDSLPAGRSGDRVPVRQRYSTPVQTCPEAHPASYTMGTGSLPGVKRPGRGVDHPPTYSSEVKERVEIYLYSPCGPSWQVIGWPLPLPYRYWRQDPLHFTHQFINWSFVFSNYTLHKDAYRYCSYFLAPVLCRCAWRRPYGRNMLHDLGGGETSIATT